MRRGGHLIISAVLFVAGWAGGWWAGGRSAGLGVASGEQTAKSDHRRGAIRGVTGLSEHAVARLQRVREAGSVRERTRELITLAQTIPVEEIEAWLDSPLIDELDPRIRDTCYQILSARLFEADPERLLRRGVRLKHDRTDEFLTQWVRSDPAAAEAFVRSVAYPDQRVSLWVPLLAVLADSTPDRALELLSEVAAEHSGSQSFSGALGRLAGSRRDKLLEASAGWPSSMRREARLHVGADWLGREFAGALAWLASEPDGKEIFRYASHLNRELGGVILEEAAKLPDGWLEAATSHGLAQGNPVGWLHADAESLGIEAEALKRIQIEAAGRLGDSEEEREAAVTLVEDPTRDLEVRKRLVTSVVADWGWEDREGVEAWLATLGDPQLREAGRSIVEFLDGAQPQEDRSPAGLVERMGRGAVRDTRFRYTETRYWTAREMDEALVAFRDLPEPERDRVATAMLEAGMSSFGPRVLAEAVTHALRRDSASIGEAQQRLEWASRVAASWGELDPAAASEWVGSLPPGEIRQWASTNLMNAWRRFSESQARSWAEGLPDATEREAVLEMLAGDGR